MIGDHSAANKQNNSMADLQLIKELNTLTLPELKTFALITKDTHIREVSTTLYNAKVGVEKGIYKQTGDNYDEFCKYLETAEKHLKF